MFHGILILLVKDVFMSLFFEYKFVVLYVNSKNLEGAPKVETIFFYVCILFSTIKICKYSNNNNFTMITRYLKGVSNYFHSKCH